MSIMSVKLPNTFIDAKTLISDALSVDKKLSLKNYGGMFANLCEVTHFHMDEVEDEEGYANVDLTLAYKVPLMGNDSQFLLVDKTKKLKVLNTAGDIDWTYNMVNLFWEGDYPSSVAVDVESGEVFLFNVKLNRVELVDFGVLTGSAFESFTHDINDREPFKIRLDEKAMFDFIDGSEGRNHLKKSTFIEFNCGMPIRVYNKRTTSF
jgi:hypothetical protein